MRDCSRKWSVLASLLVLAVVTSAPPAGLACGYHDDVSMARGLLNWVYPDALHVVGAISTAVAERRLPAPNFDAAARDLFGSKYRKTMQSLERLGRALPAAPGKVPSLSYSLVLVEPMLWTRFEAVQGELRTRLHVTGPEPGDLVLVSGEAVISEIANGRLTIGEAHRLGFIRLYGSDEQKSKFIAVYQPVGRDSLPELDHTYRVSGDESQLAATIFMRPPSTALTAWRTSLSSTSAAGSELTCGPVHH
jgi:hypothetical protein